MIYQGLFNILDLHLNEIDLFYNNVDQYFREKISNTFGSMIEVNKEDKLIKEINDIIVFLKKDLETLGFNGQELDLKFTDEFLELNSQDLDEISTILDLYEKKLAPIVYEVILEKIVDYLVDINASKIMVNLKENGLLPIEFLLNLSNLKELLKENPENLDNLKKYIQIRDKIILKFKENKKNIENLEDLEDPRDKLQLTYLIYRIIEFFHLERLFDFSHIEEYLISKIDEWLVSIPLITLKNPDLYFCGIYLAKHLNIKIDLQKVRKFLNELYEENIDEFDSPIVEATDRIYYYLKATSAVGLKIPDEAIKKLLEAESKFFEQQYLSKMETSQIVVILKMYTILDYNKIIDNYKIVSLIEELGKRVTLEGIKQFREGFISSEATYYVLFCNYMRNNLDSLKDYDLLETIVSRIYRNLEILEFSWDMNHDLVSELFYSCESLKLLNCIETKQMIIHLAKYLFPPVISERILNIREITRVSAKFRHLKVNRITGGIIY